MTKEEQRQLIAEATDQFLASKGEIKSIPMGLTTIDPSYWEGLGLTEHDGESRWARERAARDAALHMLWSECLTPSQQQMNLHGLDGEWMDAYDEESFP